MEENLVRYRTSTCNISYHLIWTVYGRRRVLDDEVRESLQTLVREIAEDKGFVIQQFIVRERNYVDCFVSGPPKLSITDIAKHLKGISGRKLLEKFPWLRKELWNEKLWNKTYYAETIGRVSEQDAMDYLDRQAKH